MTEVQYCFVLTNTGETYLKNVGIDNSILEYDDTVSTALPPGDSINVSVPGKILTSLENTLVATGTPCWQVEGVCHSIPDLAETTASDVSSVEKMEFDVGVEIENTAKLGSHDGQCDGLEFVEDKPGTR